VDGEIVVERRRQWTPDAKAALMAEVEAEGGRVSVVAQRHGVSKSLLYNWRSAWKAAGLTARARAVAPLDSPTEFVQLGVVADASGYDVAGYSCLMGADEEGTHERLRGHLLDVIEPKIAGGEDRGETADRGHGLSCGRLA